MGRKDTTVLSIVELSPVLVPYLIGFLIFKGFFSTFPLYIQVKFNLSDVEAVSFWGNIGGVAMLVGALTRVPAGILSDRIGRKAAFILGYIVYLVSIAAVYFFQVPIIYAIALSAIRFGVNTFAMSGRGIVSIAKRDRGLKNGLLSAMVGLGSFIGPSVFAYVLDNYPVDSFLLVAVILILIDLVVFLTMITVVPKFFHSIFPSEEIDLDYSRVHHKNRIGLRESLSIPGVKTAFLLFFSAGLIFGFITSVYSIYGHSILGINISLIGLIIGSGSLVQVVAAPVVGKLYDYTKDEHVRIAGWIVFVFSSGIIFFSNVNFWFYIAGYFLLTLSTSTYFTMEITRVGRDVGKSSFSLVFGIMTSLSILGSALASYTSPYFYKIDPEGTFFIALLLSFVSLTGVYTSQKRSQ